MISAFLCLVCAADPGCFVEDHVDTIAVAHLDDGADLVFFFDYVQGEWTCLDHRWISCDMAPGCADDGWSLTWEDEGDGCWRIMTAEHWVETWEPESPLNCQQNRPWFARMLMPGLKQPCRAAKP